MAIHGSQGILKMHPAAEAEKRIRRAAIPGHARPRQPGRPTLFTVDHLGRRCGRSETALCRTGPRAILGLRTGCEAQHHRRQRRLDRLPDVGHRASTRSVQTVDPDECRWPGFVPTITPLVM